MKLVFIITALESLVLTLWLTLFWSFKQRKLRMSGALVPESAAAAARVPAESPREAAHWLFINGWQMRDQANDRRPMLGAANRGIGPQSVRRSIARRTHQVRFKEWSQGRHDW